MIIASLAFLPIITYLYVKAALLVVPVFELAGQGDKFFDTLHEFMDKGLSASLLTMSYGFLLQIFA